MRKTASSIAVSPPPTTISSLSRKNAPSQVAHADTPRPIRVCSPGMPSQRALAPVAMMTVRALYSVSSTQMRKGRSEKSTRETSSVMNSVPKRSACRRKSAIMSGPITPSA